MHFLRPSPSVDSFSQCFSDFLAADGINKTSKLHVLFVTPTNRKLAEHHLSKHTKPPFRTMLTNTSVSGCGNTLDETLGFREGLWLTLK